MALFDAECSVATCRLLFFSSADNAIYEFKVACRHHVS
jgi:hypothetical protein